MKAEERSKLLRERFRAVGGVPFVGSGTLNPAPGAKPKPTRTYYPSDGFGMLTNATLKEWVRQADEKTPLRLSEGRTSHV